MAAYKRGVVVEDEGLLVSLRFTPHSIREHSEEDRYKRANTVPMGYCAPTPPAPTVWVYMGTTWRPVSMLSIRTI